MSASLHASGSLAPAELMKLGLLAGGLEISDAAQAYLNRENRGRALTPADYASTSGVILALDDDVWVNAPIAAHNANFVTAPKHVLDIEGNALVVRGPEGCAQAGFWLSPAYHDATNDHGERYTSYAFTHGDRVRISPIEGCAIACHFCNLPYEFAYRRKRVEGLVDAVARALTDEVQPASHVLISGGTPRPEDFDYLNEVYEAVIRGFANVAVDVMMVPAEGLLDVAWLDEIGVNELSINLEAYGRDVARRLMRRKADLSQERYLTVLEQAAETLGAGRVRSMLLVGLEPLEDTLAGVRAVAERGCVPVLSPFRPDAATPLRHRAPPDRGLLLDAYERSCEIAAAYDVPLGPSCIPCSHNTITLAERGSGHATHAYGNPRLV